MTYRSSPLIEDPFVHPTRRRKRKRSPIVLDHVSTSFRLTRCYVADRAHRMVTRQRAYQFCQTKLMSHFAGSQEQAARLDRSRRNVHNLVSPWDRRRHRCAAGSAGISPAECHVGARPGTAPLSTTTEVSGPLPRGGTDHWTGLSC